MADDLRSLYFTEMCYQRRVRGLKAVGARHRWVCAADCAGGGDGRAWMSSISTARAVKSRSSIVEDGAMTKRSGLLAYGQDGRN